MLLCCLPSRPFMSWVIRMLSAALHSTHWNCRVGTEQCHFLQTLVETGPAVETGPCHSSFSGGNPPICKSTLYFESPSCKVWAFSGHAGLQSPAAFLPALPRFWRRRVAYNGLSRVAAADPLTQMLRSLYSAWLRFCSMQPMFIPWSWM